MDNPHPDAWGPTPAPTPTPTYPMPAYTSGSPQQVAALISALALAQAQFAPIEAWKKVTIRPREKPEYSFHYAPLAEILKCTRPALSANGIAFSQVVLYEGDVPWLVTALLHSSGGTIFSRVPAPSPTEDPKTYGALLTFMKRYQAAAILGVAADDDLDDNGDTEGMQMGLGRAEQQVRQKPATPQRRSASPPPDRPAEANRAGGPTPALVKMLEAKAKALKVPDTEMAAWLAEFGAETLSGLSAADFAAVKAKVEAYAFGGGA